MDKIRKPILMAVFLGVLIQIASVWPPAPLGAKAYAQTNPWPWPEEPSPTPTPTPTSTALPTATPLPTSLPQNPVRESMNLKINFQKEICQPSGGIMICNQSISRTSNKQIQLLPDCYNGPYGTMTPPRKDQAGSDPTPTQCQSFQGYWIDLYNDIAIFTQSDRYIGILTVTKTTFTNNDGQAAAVYNLVAEVLGRSKTLAKAETSFESPAELQNVRLMASENIRDDYREIVYLSFGPSTNQQKSKDLNLKPELMNQKPLKWKVIKGQLLP